MNLKQRQAVLEQASKGCQVCGKTATAMVVWSFVDTTLNNAEHSILALIRCDEHLEGARSQKPQVPAHIRIEKTEETFKPSIFLS